LNRTDTERLPKLAFGNIPERSSDTGRLFSRWPKSGAGYGLIREGGQKNKISKLFIEVRKVCYSVR